MHSSGPSSLSSPPPPSSPASPAALLPSASSAPPSLLSANAVPLYPSGSPLSPVPPFVHAALSPSAVLAALRAAQDADAATRRAGSARLVELSALSGYGACLLLVALSAGAVSDDVRLLAAIELKNAIGALFATANRNAANQKSVHSPAQPTDHSSQPAQPLLLATHHGLFVILTSHCRLL